MPDDRRRELERAASLDPALEVAALRQRVRLGGDAAARVELAAALSYEPAWDAVASPPLHDHLPGEWHAQTRGLLAHTLLSGAAPAPVLPPGATPARPAPPALDPETKPALRALNDALLNDDGAPAAVDRWVAANPDVRCAAAPLREVASPATELELSILYVISRSFDYLICANDGDPLTFQRLMAAVGLDAFVHPVFHPFFHELTAVVEADDPDEPPALVDVRWPGAMFGNLLVLRSGVVVRAGFSWLDPSAATSPIYVANRRSTRPTHDLAHGSGSSSQWGTSLRRDYVTPDATFFNVDGDTSLDQEDADHPPEDDLTLEECRELVAHRSFVRDPRVADFAERYLYHWSLTLRRDALPPDSRVALEVSRGSGWAPLRT